MTAENDPARLDPDAPETHASMRPRPMTAENISANDGVNAAVSCFNEAAADDRGKRDFRPRGGGLIEALQ